MLSVLYRDESVVVIDKPAGLLVHRSSVDRGETRFALQLLRDQLGQRVYPVHRLDKPTSGALLFALSHDDAAALGQALEAQRLIKTYLAVARGWPPAAGLIDHAYRQKADPAAGITGDEAPQAARTRYERLGRVEWPDAVDRYPTTRYALLRVHPETGRRHQIRRHLKHIGHPIIGDTTYGKAIHNRYFEQRLGLRRLLLHAWRLRFPRPRSGGDIEVEAPLDECFRRVFEAADWQLD